MKQSLFFILLFAAIQVSFAQVTYPILTYTPTPEAFRYLLLTNEQIEDNDTINEKVIDLVTPMVLDSVIPRKKEHHQVFLLGWLIHALGDYNWRAMNMTKQKFVGTVRGNPHTKGKEIYTEYDINFNLFCHLPKYLGKVFESYDRQAQIGRQDIMSKYVHKHPGRHHNHRINYKAEPFVRDTNHIDVYRYRLHCEVTPKRAFRPMLNYLFFPVTDEIELDKHPNFGERYPSMGFYGVHCLDCNHTCHPEIHPYEWAWWMNLHNGTLKDKTWLLGLFKDGSNRFNHWSHNPKTGEASVPFAFKVDDKAAKNRTITIEHLVFGTFVDSNLTKLSMPATVFNTDMKSIEVKLRDDRGGTIPITVDFSSVMVHSGLRYWFSGVNWDERDHILSGYINMATSVQDVYTVKVTMSGQ
jgi:hypothetical protein